MQNFALISTALAAVIASAAGQSVSGSPEGFGAGTTGGAAGETVTPTSTDELVNYLTAEEAYTIIINQEFDFTGTEGTTTETGCAPWGTDSACQLAINANDWCGDYQSGAGAVEVTYDVAGTTAIDVASDKTILGVGSSAVIKGKGLRLANGVSNVIIQNIAITELNPQYVWGGDAITLDGSSNVWIDHVKISRIGRMFLVTGYNANTGVTVSNSEFDGQTDWSASCDGYHYWALFFIGDGDQITFKNNYVHHTSGRSPKVDTGSFVHVVNNYWYENSGHCFEGEGGYALVEGNTFEAVAAMESDWAGAMLASASDIAACADALGRECMANAYTDSPAMEFEDTSVLDKFGGVDAADAVDAASAKEAASAAGNTLSVSGGSSDSGSGTSAGSGSSNSTAGWNTTAAYPVESSAAASSKLPVSLSTAAVPSASASASAAPVPAPGQEEGDGDCEVQLIYV